MAEFDSESAPIARQEGPSYQDVLTQTRRIEREHESDGTFSVKVARYSDLQRALRAEVTAGGITQDIANRRTATLLAGMTPPTREEFENGPAMEERTIYRRVLEITENLAQAHEGDEPITRQVDHYFALLRVLQMEVSANRISQDNADRQAAILLAGIEIPLIEDNSG
jgi:hypothetical protein